MLLLNHGSFSSLSNISFFSIVSQGGRSFSNVFCPRFPSSSVGLNRSAGCFIFTCFSSFGGVIFLGGVGGHGYVSV